MINTSLSKERQLPRRRPFGAKPSPNVPSLVERVAASPSDTQQTTMSPRQPQTKPTTTISADLFRTSPLSPLWITTINDQLKTGDELFFFDIIVKDEQGRLMFAPQLKLMVR